MSDKIEKNGLTDAVSRSDCVSMPSFLGIGAAKSGTSTLHDILKEHPLVFLPERKEIGFFCTEDNYKRGVDSYTANFPAKGDGRLFGEITPQYIYEPQAVDRVKETLGINIKFIVILRNPADRAFSHYQHIKSRGFEPLSFPEAVAAEKKRLAVSWSHRMRYSYVDRGLYSKQLKRWFQGFGRDQFLILFFEDDLIKNRASTFRRIQEFLEIPFADLNLEIHSNISGTPRFAWLDRMIYGLPGFTRPLYRTILPSQKVRRKIVSGLTTANRGAKEQLDPEFRRYMLQNLFEQDISNLETLVKRSLANWRVT